MSILPELASVNPSSLTQPFWDACKRRELVLQRCTACQRFQHPPLPGCRYCGSSEIEWAPVGGTGQVYTYTVVHHPAIPQLAESVPYAAVVVELDEAPEARMVSNLLDIAPEDIRMGMPVELVWDEVKGGVVLPRFRAVPA